MNLQNDPANSVEIIPFLSPIWSYNTSFAVDLRVELTIQPEPTILETDPSELEEVLVVHDLFRTCFIRITGGTR